MPAFHPLGSFVTADIATDIAISIAIANSEASYWYEGFCSARGEWLRLPRTLLAEAIARGLMQQLAIEDEPDEGKMYGVLLVKSPSGELAVLKAFSGLLNGCAVVNGWVPPIPGRDRVALDESRTLAALTAIKEELLQWQQCPVRAELATQTQHFHDRLHSLTQLHSERKQARHEHRQQCLNTLTGEDLAIALEQLDEQSRRDGLERRHLKRDRDRVLQPLQQQVELVDTRMRELKQQRKQLSRQLQTQMHAAYWLTNFAGESRSLEQVITGRISTATTPSTMPTGTGDCCAPKLLHFAATHRWQPLAMAEFWWGPPSVKGDRIPGEFYGACEERCQPLMGFLLSGLPSLLDQDPDQLDQDQSEFLCSEFGRPKSIAPLTILYQDSWLIAVDKPAGLLSVPGRTRDRQDCVLHRLTQQLASTQLDSPLATTERLFSVHRLDQDTSGVLLLARDPETQRQLSQQFQQRQINKVYEAVLSGAVQPDSGTIDLPLWGNPGDRPRQSVDWQRGKPSQTEFQVLTRYPDRTRIEFLPLTGRTHQLRVHAADARGLAAPIVGDRLYGGQPGDRLFLHARELQLVDPRSGEPLHLKAQTPF